MPPKSSSGKIKSRSNNKSGISNLGIKDVNNTLVLTLNNLKSNMMYLNKDVIFSVSWMDIQQESSPFKIKISNDHLDYDESIIVNLNLNFIFTMGTSFTPTYLTYIINNPILITLCESFGGKSSVRPGSKVGEMLGQCCWDILPLFTERGLVTPENQEALIEDKENTSRGETEPEEHERISNRLHLKSDDNIKKAKDNEIRAELTLEPMDDADHFMHKMKVTVTAALYLESPIPEELNSTNILSLTVESIYNLPPPLCKPEFEFKSFRYCLGITLPLDMKSSEMTSRSVEETNSDPRRAYQGLSNPMLIFPNGHATTIPDKNFRAKWKKLDDTIKGRAKYTSHPVPGHTEDVKYSETIRLKLEGNNHVQWNQTYRVWLTARMEHKLRQHLEMYGMWPIEIKIEAPERNRSQSKTGLKGLKHSRIDNKSMLGLTQTPEHSKKLINPLALDLISGPIHMLALLDMSDLIYPGLSQSRVLATFLPDPTAEILKLKTGMDKFIFFNVGQSSKMSNSSATKTIVSNKTVGNLDNTSDPEKPSKGNMTVRDNVPDNNLFCTIVHVKLARPLTEKPTEQTLLLELYNVTKTLCGPKPSRDVEKEISEYFEKVVSVVSRIFQTEYKNFMKRLETANCNNTIEKTIDREHKLQLGQFLSTGQTNCSGPMMKNDFETVLHSAPQKQKSIVADFKEHLMLSGVLAKAFTMFERPMRDYISFHYEPEGHTEDQDGEYTTRFGMERLADIHTHVTGLMRKIVEKVTNSSPLQDSREWCSAKAGFLAKQLSYAIQYQEEGYVKDAERLLISRIHTDRKLNLNNAQVWEDYGRFCLGEDRLEESRDNLIRGLHIETRKETLMMLGYVSYRLKQWEKVDLYFSALTNLFETSVEAWTTFGIYYLTVGKHKEAVTALHIAQMQLTKIIMNENKGETDSSVTSRFKTNFDSEIQRNASKPLNFSKDNLHFVLNDWKASLDSELSWLNPTPYCFLEEIFSSTILIKSCPHFLTLNMFEFAETCINAHRKINKSSSLAAYYAAVSQYKQRNFRASLSHLHNVPIPLSKCLPVLVLKFHCASAMNAAQYRATLYNVPSEMKNERNKHNLVSSSGSNKENDINCINGKFSKNITKSKNLKGGLSRPFVGMHQEKPHLMTDNGGLKCVRDHWNLTPTVAVCRQYYSTMKWEVEAYKKLKWFVLTRLGRMSTEEEDKSETSAKLLQEAEQYLLRVLQHQKTPLNWYFLGVVYLKQEKLQYAEVSFTEANQLDPEFGNVWARLSLVNFRIRNVAMFKKCMIQARKYEAEPSLLKKLESLAPFVF